MLSWLFEPRARRRPGPLSVLAVLAATLLLVSIPAHAAGDSRRSVSTPRGADGVPVEREALQTDGARTRPARAKGHAGVYQIWSAWIDHYFDADRDGYDTVLDVGFDADVDFGHADVYAELYISRDGGPWNLLFVTDVFAIEGSSADDEYVIGNELLDGYPPGLYDVLIELYSADDDEFVAEYGPADSSAMSLVPLESKDFDEPLVYHGGGGHYSAGGGGISAAMLIPLIIAGRRRRDHAGRARMAAQRMAHRPSRSSISS